MPTSAPSKLDIARDYLEALAHTLGPAGQFPPIRQLCTDCGVSLSTINAALAEMENRNMVRRRQGSGIFVSAEIHHRNLCLLWDPAFLLQYGLSPIWGTMLEAVRRRADELDENLSVHFTQIAPPPGAEVSDALHERLAADIAGGNVQGVLSIGLPHELTRWIEGCGVPVVAFAGPSNYIVKTANLEVIQIGVAEMAAQGCRRLALWSPNYSEWMTAEMAETFRGGLAAHGLPFLPELEEFAPQENAAFPETRAFSGQGFAAMTRLAAVPERLRPDGIVSTDDMLTQGALMAMGRGGLTAGKDLKIATMSNRGSTSLLGWEDRITRIEFDPAKMVSAMFDILETLLRGDEPPGLMPTPVNPDFPDYRPPEQWFLIHPRLIRPC